MIMGNQNTTSVEDAEPREAVNSSFMYRYFTPFRSKEDARSFKPDAGFGYVYFFTMVDKVKIGQTTNPRKRYEALYRTAHSFGIKTGIMLVSLPCSNYMKLERDLHDFFHEERVAGTELFRLSLFKVIRELSRVSFEPMDFKQEIYQQNDDLFDIHPQTVRLKCLLTGAQGVKFPDNTFISIDQLGTISNDDWRALLERNCGYLAKGEQDENPL